MQSKLLLKIVFALFTIQQINAQNCNCDVTITRGGVYTFTSGATSGFNLNIRAGQTVCIAAGNYDLLRFRNFVGSASQPIIFKNCGGRVRIGHNQTFSAIDFQGCRYFRMTGTGDTRFEYGFIVDSCGVASAVSVGALSTDCELDHLEIAKAGFAGIMAKTDPDCNSATWRDNFVMQNVNIHHNFIHDVGGEGLYIGNSFFGSGMTRVCNGDTLIVYPHNITNLKIHYNKILRTGAEGLQVGCAPRAEIFNNEMDDTGISPFAAFQNNGLQLGGGVSGNCYNNLIKNPRGSGLILIGHLGNNRIYNNLIINAGGDGIFADDRVGSLPYTYCDFFNNTIINSGRDAMRLYNQNNIITISNNAMVKGRNSRGDFLTFQQNTTAMQNNNMNFDDIQSVGFQDTIKFRPLGSSFLVNTGTNLSRYGILKDREGYLRGTSFDVGASEYTPSVSSTETTFLDTKITCYPNPTTDFLYIEFFNINEYDLNGKFLDILDISGKIILRQNIDNQIVRVNVMHLANGMYCLKSNVGKPIFFVKQ